MIIFPAIDIKGGKVVRLLQGKFDKVTEYSGDPVAMAKLWEGKGARWLHVVDLDGAQTGEMQNMETVLQIARSVHIPVQVGGGIRKKDDIQKLLDSDIARVILGTKAVERPGIIEAFPAERIAVSLDCSNGKVTTKGWTSVADINAHDFADELIRNYGLQYLIYTDIKTDGMLKGPNFKALEKLLDAITISVIASGGIADLEDIKKLLLLSKKRPQLIGVITGKAIYEGTLDLEGAIRACSPKG
jgi:phosphoribosylformimino-5-aminoimidazole carboxamide ribotide isomerase